MHLVRSTFSGHPIPRLASLSHFSHYQLLKKRITMLNEGQLQPFRAARFALTIPLIALTMIATGQIQAVKVFRHSDIQQAYAGSIPDRDLSDRTIFVDNQQVSLPDFKSDFTQQEGHWLVKCAIIYQDKRSELYVYTNEQQCRELMPTPPQPPSPPMPVSPTEPSIPAVPETPPSPPSPDVVAIPESPPAPPTPVSSVKPDMPPPPPPPEPVEWHSFDDWDNLSAKRKYLRAMERQGATFWLNDQQVERSELENLKSDQIDNTDFSANSNNGVKTITIKVYTKN